MLENLSNSASVSSSRLASTSLSKESGSDSLLSEDSDERIVISLGSRKLPLSICQQSVSSWGRWSSVEHSSPKWELTELTRAWVVAHTSGSTVNSAFLSSSITHPSSHPHRYHSTIHNIPNFVISRSFCWKFIHDTYFSIRNSQGQVSFW